MANASPIPEGFTSITPHIICKDAAKAIDFYSKAFGAKEICRMPMPDGKTVGHCEMQFGNARVMLADEFPDMGCVSPQSIGGTPVTIHLYVDDVDAAFKQATDAGCEVAMPVTDMFWGDRYGKLTDPFGHHWSIATHTEDLSPEEIGKRAAEEFSKPTCQ